MRKYQIYFVLIFCFALISCEEVVNIPLEESEPRLVIDASIEWFKGTSGENQNIRITRTSPFYEEETEGVENARVKITSENGEEFEFLHQQEGNYSNTNFRPEFNISYELEVDVNGEIYTATETLIPVAEIDYIEQLDAGGFSGEDIEIKVFYTDPAATEDYYLFEFINEDISLEFYEDEFTNGNQIFGYYSTEDIESGDEIGIQLQGISESYYEFLFILRSQVGTNQGGPFETMPATVKGNIINRSNSENYPFGYFRLSEVDSTSYIVN
ncbi:DUF4249 domain-containing protein [Christiangramia sediminis]|uniref:DUF4249 domain-containing protein n=1 Tax=Christiangramia sediminis TaxID=2881336 RepID=A0A9X1LFY5_9FLAO|nr:DUF4249 domain-containing protein [Christiangramia sediminis]MCB7479634.1 DUF4249 domain-containing protein [Christiangramia sediminis]